MRKLLAYVTVLVFCILCGEVCHSNEKLTKIKKEQLLRKLFYGTEEEREKAQEKIYEYSKKSPKLIKYIIQVSDRDPKPGLRKYAIFNLERCMGKSTHWDQKIISAITSTALSDKNQRVRVEAILCLGRIGSKIIINKKIIKTLSHLLKNKDSEIREYAAQACWLMEKKSRPLVPILSKTLLNDSDKEVRTLCAMALGKIGPHKRSTLALFKALEQEQNLNVLRHILGAIIRMQAKAAPELIKVVKQEKKYANLSQTAAVILLARIGEEAYPAIPVLKKLILTGNDKLRCDSITALGKIGKKAKSALPLLKQMINHKNEAIRIETVIAVERIQKPDDNTFLILKQGLKDQNPQVRYHSAMACHILGKKSIPLLKRTLKDKNKEVREAAKWTIKEIQKKKNQEKNN